MGTQVQAIALFEIILLNIYNKLDVQVFDVIWLCGNQILRVEICNSLIIKEIKF
jgi:hypothetical protein